LCNPAFKPGKASPKQGHYARASWQPCWVSSMQTTYWLPCGRRLGNDRLSGSPGHNIYRLATKNDMYVVTIASDSAARAVMSVPTVLAFWHSWASHATPTTASINPTKRIMMFVIASLRAAWVSSPNLFNARLQLYRLQL